MNYRRIKNTTLLISEIGIGVWSLITDEWGGNPSLAEDILRNAYEMGINFFDTADYYGFGKGEEVIGKALSSVRDKIVILTKVGYDFYNDRPPKQRFEVDYLEKAVKLSLQRLNTDYVDILMLHNPKMNVIRDKKILEFMLSLKKDGIARMIGVALGPTLGWGEEGIEAINMGYESLEYIYNIIERYPGEDFLRYDIGHFVRVPHASDALNEDKWPVYIDNKLHRKFKNIDWIKKAIERSQGLLELAKSKGFKLSQLAVSYILANPKVTSVLPNIISVEELKEYIEASEKLRLSEGDISYINRYYEENFKDLNEESIEETKRYK
ncbi:MAG: aldo/keto reductase [Sulfolobaceae archaeon]|nr:aldo/keto reductase [Sulfolobaceae archaeon]